MYDSVISDLTLDELDQMMYDDLRRDTLTNCTEKEKTLLNTFGQECKTTIKLFYNFGYYLLRIPPKEDYDRLYNVFQRWYWNWRMRFSRNDYLIPYDNTDVKKITGGKNPS